jgi:hypothetical protein
VFSQIVQSNLNFTYAGTVMLPEGIRSSGRTRPRRRPHPHGFTVSTATVLHPPAEAIAEVCAADGLRPSVELRMFYVFQMYVIYIYIFTGCYMCLYECCKVDLMLSMLQ